MKDKSRLIALAALVLLFVALSSGGSMFNGFRLFGTNPVMTLLLIAAIVWMFCGRCGGRKCRTWFGGEEEVVVEEADDSTDEESKEA